MSLFSFQGIISLATRQPNGKPGKLIDVGNAATCQLSLSVDSTTKNESRSGQRLQMGRLITGKTATLNITFDEWKRANLPLGFYATVGTIEAGTVTAEAFPAELVAGDRIMLDHPGASSVLLTDSAAPSVPVTAGKYILEAPGNGTVQIVDPAPYTQPFKAAYSYPEGIDLALFTTPSPERYFVLDGINTETNQPVRVELYKVRFDPFSQTDLINDGYGTLPITGAVLYDSLSAADPQLGGFGRIRSVDG